MIALRSIAASAVSGTGAYYPAQWACGRLGGGFILAFHDLPAELFERQILALRPNEPVHLDEIVDRVRRGKTTAGSFAITFDDGVGETVRDISAVCLRRGWPVTFYLPTAYLDERHGLPFQVWRLVNQHLPRAIIRLPSRTLDLSTPKGSASFVGEMDRAMYTQPRQRYSPVFEELRGWLIGERIASPDQLEPPEAVSWSSVSELALHEEIRFESHGVSHTAVVALTAGELERELQQSRERISEHSNRECRHFCYPYGGSESIGPIAPATVDRMYDTAVTMARGRLAGRSRSLLPRIPVYERDEPDIVRLKVLTK